MKVLEWEQQSPDLNIIENLWRDLKHAVQNNSELKVFCQKNRGKFQKRELKESLLATGSVCKLL